MYQRSMELNMNKILAICNKSPKLRRYFRSGGIDPSPSPRGRPIPATTQGDQGRNRGVHPSHTMNAADSRTRTKVILEPSGAKTRCAVLLSQPPSLHVNFATAATHFPSWYRPMRCSCSLSDWRKITYCSRKEMSSV